jgi:cell division protein FtsI (penicillin-binding protein 3)
MTDRRYAWRVLAVTVTVLAVWVGLGARLAFLHLGPNDHLRAKVTRRHRVEKDMLGQRGRILDRDGNILALDLAVKHVIADPERIRENGQSSRIGFYLAHMLDLPPAMVFARLNRPGRRWECIKKSVHQDVAGQLERMDLDGVSFEDFSARNYPLGSLMCHIIGFANAQRVGSAGVELKMDKYLRGRPGVRVGQKDARGREVYAKRDLEIESQPGADVYLTVQQNLQFMVEQALDAAMEEYQAKGGWVVVERVRSGEILAMASRPGFDLNEYGKTPPDIWLNRALGVVYEPGSTMKGPALAAAFNEGIIRPEDLIDCHNGYWKPPNLRGLRDHHAYGYLTVADVLKKSSNIGTAQITMKLGARRFDEYMRAFGFGVKTGIDLPGEEAGILHPRSKWSGLSITRLPIGQGVAVTALQMLNAYCCIANDGFLMRPYVVQRVVDANGLTVIEAESEVVGRPIREDTAKLMRQLLTRVTEEGGTAVRAAVEGYNVAGKTGTAQKPIPGGYSDTDHVASFVGFLPAEQPEIGIIVVIDEPRGEHGGGRVAGPVFREIAEQAVRYLDIPPYDADSGIPLGRAG